MSYVGKNRKKDRTQMAIRTFSDSRELSKAVLQTFGGIDLLEI